MKDVSAFGIMNHIAYLDREKFAAQLPSARTHRAEAAVLSQPPPQDSRELLRKLDRDMNDTLRTFESEKNKQLQEVQNLRREIQYMRDRAELGPEKGGLRAETFRTLDAPLQKPTLGKGESVLYENGNRN